MLWPSRKRMTAKKTANRNCLVPNEGAFCPVGFIAIAVDYCNHFRESCEAFFIIAFKRVVAKSRFHSLTIVSSPNGFYNTHSRVAPASAGTFQHLLSSRSSTAAALYRGGFHCGNICSGCRYGARVSLDRGRCQ